MTTDGVGSATASQPAPPTSTKDSISLSKTAPEDVSGTAGATAGASEQQEKAAPAAPAIVPIFHVHVATPHGTTLRLDNVNIADTVLSIRQMLQDLPDSCHYTSFSLRVRLDAADAAAATAAGMSVDSSSELELSDFAELAQLPGMVPGAKMRMVLAPYTVRTARRQVRRLREVLEHPPTAPTQQSQSPEEKLDSGRNSQDNKAGLSAAKERAQNEPTAGAINETTAPAVTVAGATVTAAGAGADTAAAADADADRDAVKPASDAATAAAIVADVIGRDNALSTPVIDASAAAEGAAPEASAEAEADAVVDGTTAESDDSKITEKDAVALAKKKQEEAIAAAVAQVLAPVPKHRRLVLPPPPSTTGGQAGPSANAARLSDFYPLPPLAASNASSAAVGGGSAAASAALPQCVKSIVFSGFNPPPPNRRLRGELLYLEVETLEASTPLHITATTSGFFVNRSRGELFDPAPSLAPDGSRLQSHSLLHLLQRISPAFAKRWPQLFVAARERDSTLRPLHDSFLTSGSTAADADPAARQWNAAPAGTTPSAASGGDGSHTFDRNRAELDLLDSFGMEEHGLQRDWNEEYQCCKELPQDNAQERTMRSRMLHKVAADFTESAETGAKAIVDGFIPPINPMDEDKQLVYVFNSIFFSHALDGRGSYAGAGGDEAARAAANHDVNGVREVEQAAVSGLSTLLTTIVDYKGRRIVAQSIIPGILQGETASTLIYGSVDTGHSIAASDKFLALMQKVGRRFGFATRTIAPTGLTDEEREERKAQEARDGKESRMSETEPAQLCGPVECKGIEGSDGRTYVLDLVRLAPRDANYVSAADAIVGAEKDGNETEGQKSKDKESEKVKDTKKEHPKGVSTVLRTELVRQYCKWSVSQRVRERAAAAQEKAKAAESNQAQDQTKENPGNDGDVAKAGNAGDQGAKATGKNGGGLSQAELKEALEVPAEEKAELEALNVNVFMPYAASTDAAQAQQDAVRVREASQFLRNVTIRNFIRGVVRQTIVIADGAQLTQTMHTHGINMRYLGHIFGICSALESRHMTARHFCMLLEVEMIARTVKHMIAAKMRDADPACLLELVVRFLNCIFCAPDGELSSDDEVSDGAVSSPTRKTKSKGKKKKAHVSGACLTELLKSETLCFTPSSLWQELRTECESRFSHNIRGCWGAKTAAGASSSSMLDAQQHADCAASKVRLLRRVCLICGIRVVSRDYDLDFRASAGSSVTSAHGKSKTARQGSKTARAFDLDDIVDLVPVSKSSQPTVLSEHAQMALEAGRMQLARGHLAAAHELVQEAVMTLFQVCCSPHLSLVSACQTLALIMFHSNDAQAAVQQQQTVLSMASQLTGFDSAETAAAHGNLAMFLHGAGQSELALTHLRRCIYLNDLIAGRDNSETPQLYQRMANIYQDRGNYDHAVACCRAAIGACDPHNANAIQLMHNLAIAFSKAGKFNEALAAEKQCYNFYKARSGSAEAGAAATATAGGESSEAAPAAQPSVVDMQHAMQAQQSKHFLRAFTRQRLELEVEARSKAALDAAKRGEAAAKSKKNKRRKKKR